MSFTKKLDDITYFKYFPHEFSLKKFWSDVQENKFDVRSMSTVLSEKHLVIGLHAAILAKNKDLFKFFLYKTKRECIGEEIIEALYESGVKSFINIVKNFVRDDLRHLFGSRSNQLMLSTKYDQDHIVKDLALGCSSEAIFEAILVAIRNRSNKSFSYLFELIPSYEEDEMHKLLAEASAAENTFVAKQLILVAQELKIDLDYNVGLLASNSPGMSIFFMDLGAKNVKEAAKVIAIRAITDNYLIAPCLSTLRYYCKILSADERLETFEAVCVALRGMKLIGATRVINIFNSCGLDIVPIAEKYPHIRPLVTFISN